MKKFSHLDSLGKAKMVDITKKSDTERLAVARGEVHLKPETLKLIKENRIVKGDVLTVAKIGGIQAAKKTGELIPLCHPLKITNVEIKFQLDQRQGVIEVESRVTTVDKTGVEMEALTAVSVACLALYDMVKSVDREAIISNIRLIEKRGGKSG